LAEIGGRLKTYVVGGAVRDELLGLPVQDRDHVVVGSSPEEMERLGYQPVGRDFPVFLHPDTHEEYALARTERSTARGYRGFTVYAAPDVTLEDDLVRRDLTINAMARDESGALIDPHGGERDLRAGILRHVSAAFAEDPVRILRVARFAARFGFAIAPETLALMRRMVEEGESDALVPERVWQEFSKGLLEPHAERLFQTLDACGLLPRLFPELELAFEGGPEKPVPANIATRTVMGGLRHARRESLGLTVRFALLAFAARERGDGKAKKSAMRALAERVRASTECSDALALAGAHGSAVQGIAAAGAQAQLALLEAADAFRRPGRLRDLVAACECARAGLQGWVEVPYPPRSALELALAAARSVNAEAIVNAARVNGVKARGDKETAAQPSADVAGALRRARMDAIQNTLNQPPATPGMASGARDAGKSA
jgi:tRNA nucleotidyltransferase (CCA-adding enzyme)